MSREVTRCKWVNKNPLYIEYHDNEWGVPIYNDQKIFEFLLLETFQAGLSWIIILKKRENFRKACENFNYKKISNYTEKNWRNLKKNKGIVRNTRKIQAATINAISFIKIQKEFGSFSNYIWRFVNNTPIKNNFDNISQLPAKTKLSIEISSDLKKRGFKFIGPKIIYSHMQAMGIVNDHTTNCYRYKEC